MTKRSPARHAAYMRAWRVRNPERTKAALAQQWERRHGWIARLKAERGCLFCPENHPAALDFHHRDPEQKLATIGTDAAKWSVDRLAAEIEKCDVICSNCHRKLHWAERRQGS